MFVSLPPLTPFTVTGGACQPGEYITNKLLAWPMGVTCTVSFISPRDAGESTQYVFSHWGDGPRDNPRTFTVTGDADASVSQSAAPTRYTSEPRRSRCHHGRRVL